MKNKAQASDTILKCLSELDEIKEILIEREEQHGSPEKNFKAISMMWTAYLGRDVSEMDVAIMMTLFKTARLGTGKVKSDSLRDLIGYQTIALGMSED